MEMIDRYLQAIRFWLPRQQKDDIVAELAADIDAQREEREAALGHKLDQAEMESFLKQRGSPLLVANRYLPQRSLIGPLLFPIYILVAKIVVACCLVPWLLITVLVALPNPVSAGSSAGSSWLAVLGAISGQLWSIAFSSLVSVTIAFAVLEQVQNRTHFLERWNPRKLPRVHNPAQISRANSSVELAVNLIFLAWWATYMHTTQVWIGPGLHLTLNPQWFWFFWCSLALALVNLTQAGVNLLRPWWTMRGAMVRLGSSVLGAVLFCWLLKADVLGGISGRHLTAEQAAQLTQAAHHGLAEVFPVAVLVCMMVAAVDIYRMVRLRNEPAPAAENPR